MDRRTKAMVILTSTLMLFSLLGMAAVSHSPENNAQTATPFLMAGGTGLTAKIVATPHEVISGQFINASGYDIGIYVGPGIVGVKIIGVTVTNANDHGIFVQDSSNVMIKDSTVSGNGMNPTPGILENKAIELAGTTNSFVINNMVMNNYADGGIGIADDGPSIDPGAPSASASVPLPGSGNLVIGNTVINNAFGCGIVVAAYNEGGGVYHNTVMMNTVNATAAVEYVPGTLPFVGGIVVAADEPYTVASHTQVLNNFITGSLIPGIVVHSNAPGDVVSNTVLIGNQIAKNGLEMESPNTPHMPAGIMIVAEVFPGEPAPPAIDHTFVLSDTISDDYYGVFINNSTRTQIASLQTSNVLEPVHIVS